jgi:hypothetical protein
MAEAERTVWGVDPGAGDRDTTVSAINCPDCGGWLFSWWPEDAEHATLIIPCDGCPAWWEVTVYSDGCASFEVAPMERRWDRDAD